MAELRLSFDPQGALAPGWGLDPGQYARTLAELAQHRDRLWEVELPMFAGRQTIPAPWEPLDVGFVTWPRQMLAAYQADRRQSELGRVLAAARRLRDQVDRVVVLGIGGSSVGAAALMQACCQPYYNELSRGERGGRPRMYFEGDNLDNDAVQGLLALLGGSRRTPVDDDWALVVISKSGGTLETAAAFRLFLAALRWRLAESAPLGDYVVSVTGDSGKLYELSQALQVRDRFTVPEGIGGRFSLFTPVGLLPAAILGIDVVALLQGAADLTESFRTAPPEANPVLPFVAVNHLWEQRGARTRVLAVWSKALERVGAWYDQLLAESLGKHEQGALPLTTVNTRDLHSRAQQHQEGPRDKLINNLIIDRWRSDPLAIEASDLDQDELNRLAGWTLPDLITAAFRGTNQALHDDRRPTTDLHLAQIDEYTLGQLFQMLMLATVIEGRLLQINPYGQPGVEKYKQQMRQILQSGPRS